MADCAMKDEDSSQSKQLLEDAAAAATITPTASGGASPELRDELSDDDQPQEEEAAQAEKSETVKKETEEEARIRKEKYKNWPLKDIDEPHDNDVMYGRGGGTNHHPGNKRYRKMVEDRKVDYVNSKRLDKPLVALEIIREWRSQEPPGRFLKLDEKTKKWNDVGDKKAREKTSQALREKAPLIRKKQEEERMAEEGTEESEPEPTKSTRFAEGTNMRDGAKDGGVSKAVLARDHSLGREYLEPDQSVTLDGFSWQDPFQNGDGAHSPKPPSDGRVSSQGSAYHPGYHPPPPAYAEGMPPYRYPSGGSVGPPMPPGPQAYTHVRSGEERHYHYTQSGRYESWGNNSMPPPIPGVGYSHRSGGSWGEPDHSLGQNPLPHASVGHAAPYSAFDPRTASGRWGPVPPPPPPGTDGYPPHMSGPPPYTYSGGSHHSYPRREYSGGPPVVPSPAGAALSNSSSHHSSSTSPSSPRFEVDPKVASTWSGQNRVDVAQSWPDSGAGSESYSRGSGQRKTAPAPPLEPGSVPKPDFVKRATSHQNETVETRPDLHGRSVKRAALNRDNSTAANRLKEQYMPDYFQMKKFNDELLKLSDEFGGEEGRETAKPKPLSQEERVTTIDRIAMDLMVKPEPLSTSNRSSTIEALDLDFENDPLIKPEAVSRTSTVDGILTELKEEGTVVRPPALGPGDRITTSDVMAIVNAPIPDDDMELVSGNRQVI